MSLKEKAIHGAKWAMIDKVLNYGGSFVISLALARLLTPSDYGLIGMVYIFIVLSDVFISSGLGHSLIRTKDTTQKDYSTVFIFNVIACIIIYFILFFTSPFIASFFNQPVLIEVLRVSGLSIIIYGFSVVQTTIRCKEINYKIQAQISIVGTVISGVIAIIMAYEGFGVWSLVAQQLIKAFASTVLYWITSNWRPAWVFSKEHFKKHWSYGFSMLRLDITIVFFDNLYTIVIGKYYSAAMLGQFSRAKNFTDLSSSIIYRVLSNGVSFPVLCKVNDNLEELKRLFQRFMKLIVFLSCTSTFFFVAVSDSFIPFVIGHQWMLAIKFVKIISISAFLFPINTYTISIAKVIGKPNVFANAILFQRLLIVPAVVIGIFTNIEILVWSTVVTAIFSLFYNSFKVRQMLNITIREQLIVIFRVVTIPLFCAVVMYMIWLLMPAAIELGYILLTQLLVGFGLFFGLCQWKKQKEYLELKLILLKELKKIIGKK
ncbi:MAG: lipopolysaccharide biosynthesis protein [Tannerella sp.]|jgi:O-antigen/teichoic acid export membrane protein|nr:lipopolysaccharide biosynthesis protein [Tannerella sp.]